MSPTMGSNATGISIKSLKTFDVHWRTVRHVSFFVCITVVSQSVKCHFNTGQLFQSSSVSGTVVQCQWYMHIGKVFGGIPLK